jgi:hypothetical protein
MPCISQTSLTFSASSLPSITTIYPTLSTLYASFSSLSRFQPPSHLSLRFFHFLLGAILNRVTPTRCRDQVHKLTHRPHTVVGSLFSFEIRHWHIPFRTRIDLATNRIGTRVASRLEPCRLMKAFDRTITMHTSKSKFNRVCSLQHRALLPSSPDPRAI